MDREILLQALRNADAAGDTDAAQRIAQLITEAPAEEVAAAVPAEFVTGPTSPVENSPTSTQHMPQPTKPAHMRQTAVFVLHLPKNASHRSRVYNSRLALVSATPLYGHV